MNTAYDGLLHELQKQGACLLNKAQTEQLVNIVLQPKKGGGHEVNKKWCALCAIAAISLSMLCSSCSPVIWSSRYSAWASP